MAKIDYLVPARYYLRLAEVLARDHVDIADLLIQPGTPLSALKAADATIRFSRVERLVQQLHLRSPRTDLGFEMGRLLTLSTHSIVGFGMLSSPTVLGALQFITRYFRLVMPTFRMRLRLDGGSTELLFEPVVGMSHMCLAFHLEAIAMAALRDMKDMTGDPSLPAKLYFSIPEPPHVKRYAELEHLQYRFGVQRQPGVRVSYAQDFERFPMHMADANSLKVAEERCNALVQHAARERRFSDWVAMTLREVGDGGPSLQEMARTLNLSMRTLNRYLQREGSSFREIAGRIQHELACERLAAGTLSVTEVAYSLGFSDIANFTRAFRQRAGCSPSTYRLRDRDRREPSP
ncbi:AraC family transcriptional regulator [Solimonas variicoloris]|uniref:AraC family transcriptional regulator n=1 Tax=Solimonas variicoloris TaxID=254408 RepID=UPI00037D8F43|nr:AraC family transcriptional regulator [Solimonas variicoloris]